MQLRVENVRNKKTGHRVRGLESELRGSLARAGVCEEVSFSKDLKNWHNGLLSAQAKRLVYCPMLLWYRVSMQECQAAILTFQLPSLARGIL